ncbi:serine acetyltransferase, partial [Escherichia coli]|nr:serine acetyltransferase [Escherichia coli]
ANSCIISDHITIGDNVKIGAFTFVNKDIPSNSTYYTKKINICKEREA